MNHSEAVVGPPPMHRTLPFDWVSYGNRESLPPTNKCHLIPSVLELRLAADIPNLDTDKWDKSIRTNNVYGAVGKLILKYKDSQPELMHPAVRGAYNTAYPLKYKDGSSAVMRVPIKGMS